MNSVKSNRLSLKYERFKTSGCKDLGIRKFEFVTKINSLRKCIIFKIYLRFLKKPLCERMVTKNLHWNGMIFKKINFWIWSKSETESQCWGEIAVRNKYYFTTIWNNSKSKTQFYLLMYFIFSWLNKSPK